MKRILIIVLVSFSMALSGQVIKENRVLLADSIKSLKLRKGIEEFNNFEISLTRWQMKKPEIFWTKSLEAISKSIDWPGNVNDEELMNERKQAKMELAYEIILRKFKELPEKKRKKAIECFIETRNIYIAYKLDEEKKSGRLSMSEYDFAYRIFSTGLYEADDLKSARVITFKIVSILDKSCVSNNSEKIETEGIDRLIRLVEMGLNQGLVLQDFRYLLTLYRDAHPIDGYGPDGKFRDVSTTRDQKIEIVKRKINQRTNLGVTIEPKEMDKYRKQNN